jgi:hypothetical protein
LKLHALLRCTEQGTWSATFFWASHYHSLYLLQMTQ